MSALSHREISTNGIRLHVVTAGPEDGPMVLMLHGFPEGWWSWHRHIGPLAERGYLVVVPDQRGYGPSDKPSRIRDYRMEPIVADALGLADHFGRATFDVVCHDWGGFVGWWLATEHPDRVASFCVMNVAHPRVFARALRTPAQLRRSWYMFAMQVPGLPEWLLTRNDHARLVEAMVKNVVHPVFDERDIEQYRECWRQPGCVPGMVAWYRALFRKPELPSRRRVTVPSRIVWGKQDEALGFEMVAPSARWCDRVEVTVIEDAGHFVQHDAAAEVEAILASWLSGNRT